MTAMRLKRYPSPSGGIALGKVGAGATMLKQGKTARDYVQDGLIAMWDGIENAGWGVHDANATTWKDLIGSYNAAKNGSLTFEEKFISLNGGYFLVSNFPKSTFSGGYTIEICVSANEQLINAGLYSTNDNGIRSWFSTYSSYYNNTVYVRSANVSMVNQTDVSDIKTIAAKADGNAAYSYKNGIVEKTASVTQETYTGTTPLYLFRLNGFNNFNGRGHAIRLYSRALTAAEIAANYAIDKERFNLP